MRRTAGSSCAAGSSNTFAISGWRCGSSTCRALIVDRVARPIDSARMATIHLTDIYGQRHTIDAQPGPKLMEVLREYEFGVIASCGGFLSCATCHVYIDPAWISRLPEMQF